MGKKPTDQLHGVRIELQQSERDALNMVAMTKSIENVSSAVENIISPFTKCSVPGLIFASTLFEAFLFTQNKGILHTLWGFGKDVGEASYSTASDVVSRMQKNYEEGRVRQEERMNPDHQTEISERTQLRDYMEESKTYSWSPLRGGWVDPVTGEVVSTDRNDPLYAPGYNPPS